MSRTAKATLVVAAVVSGVTIWGVHYMQKRELDVSYALYYPK